MPMKQRTLAFVLIGIIISGSALLTVGCRTMPPREDLEPLSSIETGWTGSPLVETFYGKVLGSRGERDTWVWKSIPYAQPPAGELRWKAPRKPMPWEGIRKRQSFPRPATQLQMLTRGQVMGTEDCLYLNVWRPRTEEKDLPVFVWIHGGGNSIGSSTMTRDTDGHNLAVQGNLIFVSINYRLGPFGWFTHPALREGEDALDASGNYGTLDQIEALKWVRENIAAFGGNPDMVTIAGESAGGANVLTLLLSPLSDGLFHRAVVQSGYDGTTPVSEGDEAADEVLRKLLIDAKHAYTPEQAEETASEMPPEQIAQFLRSRFAGDIIENTDPQMAGMHRPKLYRDGTVIPEDGFESWSRGEHIKAGIPVMIGSNKDETRLFLLFNSKVRRDRDLYEAIATYGSDLWKATGVDEPARRLTSAEEAPPVYVYYFHWGSPDEDGSSPLPGKLGRLLGAAHFLDVPFFMGSAAGKGFIPASLVFTKESLPGRAALTEAMMSYLIGFIHTGDPNSRSRELTEWPRWSPERPDYIIFDTDDNVLDLRVETGEYREDEILDRIDAIENEEFRRKVLKNIELRGDKAEDTRG